MKYKIGDKVICNLGSSRGEKGLVVGTESSIYIIKGFIWGSDCYNEKFKGCHMYSEEYLDPELRNINEILLTQILNNN